MTASEPTPPPLPNDEGAPTSTAMAAPTAEAATRSGESQPVMAFIEKYALVMLFAVVFIFFCFWSKTSATFPTKANITNVLGDQAVIGGQGKPGARQRIII